MKRWRRSIDPFGTNSYAWVTFRSGFGFKTKYLNARREVLFMYYENKKKPRSPIGSNN